MHGTALTWASLLLSRDGFGLLARADLQVPLGLSVTRVSGTGYLTAWARALSRLSDPPEVANDDDLARHFVLARYRLLNRVPRLARRLVDARTPGAVAYFNGRTKHFDAVLLQELATGLEQLVVLGAGFDSRALRFDGRLGDVRVFEVDHAGVLAAKRRHLAVAKLRPPARLTHVPVDFTKDDLARELVAAGYATSARTLLLWEGVSYYLGEENVTDVLRFARDRTGAGSSILFDYTTRAFFDGDHSGYGARQLAEAWKKMGNVHRSSIASVGGRLAGIGLTLDTDIGAAELEGRYLTPRSGSMRRAWGVLRIAHARNVRPAT
jgi:methyltransferase (TIGR00027 family)